MKLYYFLIVFISSIGMLLLSNKIYKNKYISLICSSLYICMPYFISDYLVRDATSETLIFMVLPYIYLGLLYLLDNDYKKFIWIFSLSYIVGMNSHLVMMVYITFFVLLFLLFNIKKVLNKKTFKYLIISGIFILLGSSSVIVRMFEYHNLGYTVFSDGAMATYDSLMTSIVNFKELTYAVLSNNIGAYINVVALILLVLCLVYKFIYKIKYNIFFKYIITSMIILLILMMCPYIWKVVPHFLYNIQFVWRLDTLFVFFISLYCVSCIKYIKFINIKKLTTCLLIFMLIGSLLFINRSVSTIGMSTYKYYDNTDGMGWQKEYLPVNTTNNIDYYNNRSPLAIIRYGKGSINTIYNNTPSLSFEIRNISNSVTVEIPRIYYLGYKITDNDNNNIDYYENEYGFIELKLNNNGKYYVKYVGTLFEHISRIISIITIILLVILKFVW